MYSVLYRYCIALFFMFYLTDTYGQIYVEDIYFESNESNPDNVSDYDLIIRVSDTFNLDRIELNIGNTPGDTTIFHCNYLLHTTVNGCQDNFTRNGVQIALDMDSLTINGISFYQVKLYDFQNNQISSYIKQL